jgi:hypothetical protein
VVDFLPFQLATAPGHEEFRRFWPDLLDSRDSLDLACTTADAGLLAQTMLGRALPSYRVRNGIGTNLLAALRGLEPPPRVSFHALRKNWDFNEGAQVLPVPNGDRLKHIPPDAGPTPGPWACDPATGTYLTRFLDLAQTRGIRVYWLLPPLYHPSRGRHDQLRPDYERFVRTLYARYPNLVILDGRRAAYGPERFVDAVHLDYRAACALSTSLAALLAREPANTSRVGRWLELPGHREQAPDQLTADFQQSRLASASPNHRRR